MEISFEFKQNTITLDFSDIDIKELSSRDNDFYKVPGIYALLNKENEIIYIGITNNLGSRVRKHIQGTTHTSYFHTEVYSVSFYIEEDDYEREALEKLLIKALKPTYNETSKGLRLISDEAVYAVKHLLNTGRYTQSEIATKTGISAASVCNINKGMEFADLDIPDGYNFDDFIPPKKTVDKEEVRGVYLDFLKGKSFSELQQTYNLSADLLKSILSSTQPFYKETREKVKKTYKDEQKQKLIADIFRLRYKENKTLTEIGKLKGIAHCTVSRYLKIYTQKDVS